MALRPCTSCGEPHDGPGRCPDCAREADARRPRTSATRRGYNAAWERLSRRARRLQRFCLDCGSTEDLTVDHLPVEWERRAQGLQIRLQDVEVVCRSCNARRGRARPPGPQGRDPQADPSRTTPVSRETRYTPLTSTNPRPSHNVGHSNQEVGA